MRPDSPEKCDFRRLATGILMLVTFLGSAKVSILYPDYSGAVVFWGVVIQLLLVLSYYNHQR